MRHLAIALAAAAFFCTPLVQADERDSDRRVRHKRHYHELTPPVVDGPRVGEADPYAPKVGAPDAYAPKAGAPNPYAPTVGAPNPYATRGGDPVRPLPTTRQSPHRH
jgi:hypothetical protein